MQVQMWKHVQNVILNYERGELSNKDIIIRNINLIDFSIVIFTHPRSQCDRVKKFDADVEYYLKKLSERNFCINIPLRISCNL